MAVRTTEEIMASLRERMGEDTTDEALEFIADVQDTLNAHDNSEMKTGNRSMKKTTKNGDKNIVIGSLVDSPLKRRKSLRVRTKTLEPNIPMKTFKEVTE